MTLEKAILTLGSIKQERIPVGELEELKALNIAIEAVKRTNSRREILSWKFEPLLPGETTE